MSRYVFRGIGVLTVIAVVLGVFTARGDARPGENEALGGPWISVEYPANPYDAAQRGAFLVVNTYHHSTPMNYPVSGRAEGLIDGKRRSMPLEISRTARPGAHVVRSQWTDGGPWVLVISTGNSPGDGATVLVEVRDGAIASVKVPTERVGNGSVARPATGAEIEALLARRVAGR